MSSRSLSTSAFALTWLAVYVGAALHPDHRLTLVPLLIALAAAALHLVLEIEHPAPPLTPGPALVRFLAWCGWLLPVMSLRPLWPLALASLATTILRLRPPAPLTALDERLDAPPVTSQAGGWLRTGLAVATAAVCLLDGSLGPAVSPGALLLLSWLAPRDLGRGKRVGVVVLGVLSSVGVIVGGLAIGLPRATTPEARHRAIAVALAAVALLGWAVIRDRTSADVRHRATRALGIATGAAVLIITAASPVSLLALIPDAWLESAPVASVWRTPLDLALVVGGCAVLLGARRLSDLGVLRARVRLRWPGLGVIAACVAVGVALGAGVASRPDFEVALGGVAMESQAFANALGDSLVGILLFIGLGALVEEVQFRGVLLPRVGLLASTSAFAAIHVLQAGAPGLWLSFTFGGLFALLAVRWGLAAPMAMHASYNVALLVGSIGIW